MKNFTVGLKTSRTDLNTEIEESSDVISALAEVIKNFGIEVQEIEEVTIVSDGSDGSDDKVYEG